METQIVAKNTIMAIVNWGKKWLPTQKCGVGMFQLLAFV
jgi:hypothetical protein